MVLTPKHPFVTPHRQIYKGYVEEGPGQYPIAKTKDWVEDLGGLQDKIFWAAKHGFVLSTATALIDIRHISQIKERKSQIARYAFYTVPLTLGAVSWMGGVELGKIWLGRKDEKAWIVGSVMPAGIFGIWRRCPYKGLRTAVFLSAIGWAYQYSTNNNLVNTFLYPNVDNPNLPHPKDPFTKDFSLWNLEEKGTDKEYSSIVVDMGIFPKAAEPSWKKWE